MVEILTYIHTHIAEKLSAAEVAARFGYSKWYFSARFHAYTGKTFVEYVRHTRISLAAMEVLAGKKITDTAMDYGYDTVSGFQKAFFGGVRVSAQGVQKARSGKQALLRKEKTFHVSSQRPMQRP